ncbi:ABC transporter substrate-binding protein [Rhodococcus sp. OK302]|uniref:ABC transporter substrate-binding protein n=1 Tax=Rhodococcus sp. OK302 TaxID=1882769 RepID=UPI000B93A340|nr:ABC transporter substrate-binding protein [Rhodococcus sp. OK302]OYD70579.1 ABC-type branched-subunit amino acid transport system substrate-binding protein [Rhodococcus sp. OK302]
MKNTLKVLGPTLVIALAVAGCSSKATDSDSAAASGDLKTGIGVTADAITLGSLVPLSGPIGGLGQDGVAGIQLWFDKVNANGGVCDRQVRIESRDNKYNSQETMTQYTSLRSDIAAIVNLSPGTDAVTLGPKLAQDGLGVMAGSFDPVLLAVPEAFMPGTPYDVEAVNGVAYLVKQGTLKEGDTIGVIAYPNGIGAAVTNGVAGAAKQFGLKVENTKIDSTATDATSQVNTLRQSGAKAIVMGTAAAQTVSAASVAKASGYDVVIQATNLLSSGDLAGPARDALVGHVVLTSNNAPFSSNAAPVQELLAAWTAKYGDRAITSPAASGYLMARLIEKGLNQACKDNDLTPKGITAAMSKMGAISNDGLAVDLDYSTPGKAPSLSSFIIKPDPNAKGGTVIVQDPAASDAAVKYAADKGYAK